MTVHYEKTLCVKCHDVKLYPWHCCSVTTRVDVRHLVSLSSCGIFSCSSAARWCRLTRVVNHVTSLSLLFFWEAAVNSSKRIWGVWAQHVTLFPSTPEIWLQNAETSSTWASLLRDHVWWGWSMLKQGPPPPLGIFNVTTFDMEQGKKFRGGLSKSTSVV